MSNEVFRQISSLPEMKKTALVQLWKERFQSNPNPRFRPDMMIHVLAHRIQEQAFGPLSSDLVARLRSLGRAIESDPDAPVASGSTVKPGTRLVRHWKGRNHLITVEQSSFEYRGERYESLSEIARLITGSRWSGPLFFGLRSKPEAAEVQHGQ